MSVQERQSAVVKVAGEGLVVTRIGSRIVIESILGLENLAELDENDLRLLLRFVKSLLYYKRGI